MMHEENRCETCSEVITNPVCGKCHEKHIDHWLKDNGVDEISRRFILIKINEKTFVDSLNENYCVVCGRETLATCSYCYFLRVAQVLKQFKFNRHLIDNFLEIFNYRQGHEDYTF